MPALSLALAIRNRNENIKNIKNIYEYHLLKEKTKEKRKKTIFWRFKKFVKIENRNYNVK